MPLKKILLATDFSPNARKAYPVAAELARRFGASIYLVHVAPLRQAAIERVIPKEEFRRELENALALEARSHSQLRNLVVEPVLLFHAMPHQGLRVFEAENSIDLAIVATHGHRPLEYFLLGSFAERAVHTAASPVLVYREAEHESPPSLVETVLVPFDFSEVARAALPAARCLRQSFDCRFVFLNVHDPTPQHPPVYERIRRALHSVRHQEASRFRELARVELPAAEVAFENAEGAPHLEIVRRARELKADLVLLGTRGLLGSVAQSVAREAPCSVMAVPGKES
jgi:nucleotide-binding universal stress UspA family protein